MAIEGVVLPHDQHAVQVLRELGVHVKLQDVALVRKLVEVSERHLLEGTSHLLLVSHLWKDVVIVLVKELLDLSVLSHGWHVCHLVLVRDSEEGTKEVRVLLFEHLDIELLVLHLKLRMIPV